ncbi:MAG: transposase domain-containing protein [Acidiferrobacterales bacterium]
MTRPGRVLSLDEAAALGAWQLVELSRERVAAKHQIDGFKRQIFGQKSERRPIEGADGQQDEVCFPFFGSRRAEPVEQALSLTQAEGAVLLSDGYRAYAHYANKTGLTHVQCWAVSFCYHAPGLILIIGYCDAVQRITKVAKEDSAFIIYG